MSSTDFLWLNCTRNEKRVREYEVDGSCRDSDICGSKKGKEKKEKSVT